MASVNRLLFVMVYILGFIKRVELEGGDGCTSLQRFLYRHFEWRKVLKNAPSRRTGYATRAGCKSQEIQLKHFSQKVSLKKYYSTLFIYFCQGNHLLPSCAIFSAAPCISGIPIAGHRRVSCEKVLTSTEDRVSKFQIGPAQASGGVN